MNNIVLRGYLRDIEYSHNIGDIEYEKANLICPNSGGKDDDIISLRYKKYTNKYKDGDFIEINGNLRSYSTKVDNKNNVQIYVFTYFDTPDVITVNNVELDGRICKINGLKKAKSGKEYLHFILANNIFVSNNKKINSYIPCTCYGDIAAELSQCSVNDKLEINGEFHSHCYKKYLEDGTFEYRIAHEVVIKNYSKI